MPRAPEAGAPRPPPAGGAAGGLGQLRSRGARGRRQDLPVRLHQQRAAPGARAHVVHRHPRRQSRPVGCRTAQRAAPEPVLDQPGPARDLGALAGEDPHPVLRVLRRPPARATDRANDQCIGRAVATAPAGPYTAEASPVYCGLPAERGSNPWGRGALDPEVFRAPDGALYLLVAVSRTRDNIGVLRLTADGKVVGGINAQPTTLVSQRFGWHDGVDDAKLGATFLENPSMAYERATRSYLLFYSAGDWRTSRYLTGFARCATPTGPCTVDGRGPFLKAGSGRSGVGGLTAFRDPAGVLRVAYASWQAGSESAPSGDGSLSRHTTLARVVVSGTNPDTQTVALVPS
ncbi:MAG: family 43 glycosylhydrolase [Acidimicrobiales bacterium]